MFVSCVHNRVVEGSWEGILLGVQCMLMCMKSVYVVGGCNVVAIEHGRYSLFCMQKLSSAGSVMVCWEFSVML